MTRIIITNHRTPDFRWSTANAQTGTQRKLAWARFVQGRKHAQSVSNPLENPGELMVNMGHILEKCYRILLDTFGYWWSTMGSMGCWETKILCTNHVWWNSLENPLGLEIRLGWGHFLSQDASHPHRLMLKPPRKPMNSQYIPILSTLHPHSPKCPHHIRHIATIIPVCPWYPHYTAHKSYPPSSYTHYIISPLYSLSKNPNIFPSCPH